MIAYALLSAMQTKLNNSDKIIPRQTGEMTSSVLEFRCELNSNEEFQNNFIFTGIKVSMCKVRIDSYVEFAKTLEIKI